jgi:hypothetical protein
MLPPNISLAEEVADHLGISTDSSYRRIRGEKAISIEEIQKLCSIYKISLDQLLSIDSNSTVFYGKWIDAQNFDFGKYLDDMLIQLQIINKAEVKKMYYEAKDLPPFHHFQFPLLTRFKYFFWMKTILSYPEFNKMKFEECEIENKLYKTGIEIVNCYNKIPSIEIWGEDTINSTIQQIRFYNESGIFKKEESVQELFIQLEELVNHFEKQAENGKKFMKDKNEESGENNFQLFYNEVFMGHNSILTEMDKSYHVFINHGVLNYMITHDKNFCDYTKKTFENTMSKSSLISSVNEKDRKRFFGKLRQKIVSVR